jgi:hypothetical protein
MFTQRILLVSVLCIVNAKSVVVDGDMVGGLRLAVHEDMLALALLVKKNGLNITSEHRTQIPTLLIITIIVTT